MKFGQRRPCGPLQHLVKFFWMLEDVAATEASTEIVVPDGCMEMIFHFGAPCASGAGEHARALHPRALIGGQITQSIAIHATGPIGMLGVRFHPFGAQPLLKLPMDSIAGKTINAADLLGSAATETVERLMMASDIDTRFDVVESLLLRLLRSATAVDPLAHASIKALTAVHGAVAVHRLAADLHVSPRHLNRVLRRHVGLSAKSFARITRLQFALKAASNGEATTLADAAHAAGYFDQAHFIRDFQAFCGVSPGNFIGQRHALAEAFA